VFSKEVIDLLLQVLKSWQVIAITLAIILYMTLVSYVARTHHRPRASKSKAKAKKQKSAAAAAGPEETGGSGSSVNDELGLEEA
jgi:flagellar biosynthesis/type III secretory pathway M-ring protein FliF/YscJ